MTAFRTNEELAQTYNFCRLGEDGYLELFLDNVMLSSFRKCQGNFQEQFLLQDGKRLVPVERQWSLEFGTYVHKCLEYFYQGQKENWEGIFIYPTKIFTDENGEATNRAKQDLISFQKIVLDLWVKYDLEFFMAPEFKKHIGKAAHALGGIDGAATLFLQYFKQYWRQERYRFVGSEMTFGYGKEIPIVRLADGYRFRGYLCGRIDQPVDDGKFISPMDFKTHAYFDGTEKDMFKPHDGIQGYTYALNELLPEEYKAQGRDCHSAVIRHISVRYDKDERFKSSEIFYTPGEMEAWLKRQQATFTQIYRVLSDFADITWNTENCDSWFYSKKCPYKPLHESSSAGRAGIIKTFYKITEPWSHENNGK